MFYTVSSFVIRFFNLLNRTLKKKKMNMFIYHRSSLTVFILVMACLSIQICDSRPNRYSRTANQFEAQPNFRDNWNGNRFPSFDHNPFGGRLTEPNGFPVTWPPHNQRLPQVWSPKEVMMSPPTEFPSQVPNDSSVMPHNSMASATMYNLWLTSTYLRLMAANAMQNMNSLNDFSAQPTNSFNQQMSNGLSSGTPVSPLLEFVNKIVGHRLNNDLSYLNGDVDREEDRVEVTLDRPPPSLSSSAESTESLLIHTDTSFGNITDANDNGDVDGDSEMQVEDITEEVEEDDQVSGEDLEKHTQSQDNIDKIQAELLKKAQGTQESIHQANGLNKSSTNTKPNNINLKPNATII